MATKIVILIANNPEDQAKLDFDNARPMGKISLLRRATVSNALDEILEALQ